MAVDQGSGAKDIKQGGRMLPGQARRHDAFDHMEDPWDGSATLSIGLQAPYT